MKIKLWASTPYIKSTCVTTVEPPYIKSTYVTTVEIHDDEWQGMDSRERDEYMRDELWSIVEWGYEEVASGS